ncbi:MAG: ferredoxin reductase family protein [Alphaproteobacteria bacterium]|nr:ferredoxin reductase family protein [Alphaproteobacteria bacterium]
MNARVLIILYLGVVLLPLGLAAASGRPPRSFWDELASGAGLLAFAIILVEFVLSGRFRTVSRRLGMDMTMRFHQLIARTALLLALLHPFLYLAPFNPPYVWDWSRQLTLYFEAEGLITGTVAWLLLATLVALGMARRQLDHRYETWRLMHGLGALLIAGLLLDHSLVAGRYSQDPAMVYLWTGLFAVAVLSLAYVYILKPFQQTRRPWTVRGVRPLGPRTWELTLDPEGHDGLTFDAGQFVWLNVGSSPFSVYENPFSLSSAPGDGPHLQFVIKELGDFTRTVGSIAPGTRAHVDGPYGHLVVSGRPDPGIVLLAGGVGIAPMMGILRELRHRGDGRPRLLVYGNRIAEQIAYADELAEMAEDPEMTLVHVVSEPPADWTGRTGVVDGALLKELFAETPAMRDWLFVICGPPAMIEGAEKALIDLGVPRNQIESERFQYD